VCELYLKLWVAVWLWWQHYT